MSIKLCYFLGKPLNMENKLKNENTILARLYDNDLSSFAEEGDRIAHNIIRTSAFCEIDGNKTLNYYLQYRGCPVWWVLDTALNYSHPLFLKIRDIIRKIIYIKSVFDRERFDEVISIGLDENFNFILEEFCGIYGIKYNKSLNVKKIKTEKSRITLNKSMKFLLNGVISKLIGLFTNRFNLRKSDVLFISRIVNWRKTEYIKGKKTLYDVYLGPAYSIVNKFKSSSCILLNDYKKLYLKRKFTLKPGFKTQDYYIIDFLIRKNILGCLNYYNKKLMKTWRKIVSSYKFIDHFSYENINFFKLIEKDFNKLVLTDILNVLISYEFMDTIICREKPKIIVLTDEYSAIGRIATHIASKKGIRTVGVQHGVIHPSHPGYIYEPLEKLPENYKLPEYLAVDGEYYKRLLHNTAWKNVNIVCTGQIRYDRINFIKQNYTRQSIIKELGLDEERRTIVFLTQSPNEWIITKKRNIELTKLIIEALNKIAGFQLIIKTHPHEIDTSIYLGLTSRANFPIKIITGYYDVYKILNASEIAITLFSTSGIEALFFNCKLIIPEIPCLEKLVPQINLSNTMVWRKNDKLEVLIKKLTKIPKLKHSPESLDAIEKEYAWRLDGKSASRIAKLILKI